MTNTLLPSFSQSKPSQSRILIIEYITAGGLYREHIPPALIAEATLMRDAMLTAMGQLDDVHIMSVHDDRFTKPKQAIDCRVLRTGESPWQVWQQLILSTDMVWLVAPETEGTLARLSEAVIHADKILLSSTPDAVKLASSKWQTYECLSRAGVSMVKTTQWPGIPVATNGWVVKPDDGVSCDGARYFREEKQLADYLMPATMAEVSVIQPFVPGIAASMSILCRRGQAWLLTCNQQLIQFDHQHFHYQGGIVNGLLQYQAQFSLIAQQVAAAMPGLFGYVGVDMIIDLQEKVHVLEVNPRLTTSFAGMSEAIGYNPARLLLDLFYNEDFKLPLDLQHNRIEIKLND